MNSLGTVAFSVLRPLGKSMLYLITSIALIYFSLCLLVYFFQEHVLFFPEKLSDDFNFKFQIPAKERFFRPEEGVVLNALHFTHAEQKPLILYFHGNAGSLRTWGEVAIDFHRLGFEVLIFDYRGYGKSKGSLSEMELLADAQFIYDQVKLEYGEENIIVFGRSIGCGMASFIAANNKPRRLILETPFFNLAGMARTHYPYLPSFLLRYQFANNKYIAQVSCPIAIFHGTADNVVPFASADRLRAILKKEDQFVRIDGANHGNLGDFKEYWTRMEKILSPTFSVRSVN